MLELHGNEKPGKYVERMLENGEKKEDIEKSLIDLGHDRRYVLELVEEIAKMKDASSRSMGLTLILAGAVICFISFLLTVTSTVSGDAYNFVLFGLTSLGVIVIFAGFTKVF
jgi:hypothetical protein